MEEVVGSGLGIAIALAIWIVVGAVAGWLATWVMGGGVGLVGDILLGMLGATVAGYLFPTLGISLGGGVLGVILSAAIGAIIILGIIRLIKSA
ncbi:MAG: GlsB/YeaQ/YmgE family stress response membrane protein [Hyphomicrobium sp.]